MNNQIYNSSIAFAPKVLKDFGIRVILLITAFVFSCTSAIASLIKTWSVRDVYSYGFLVPFISLLWIWHEKERVRHLPIKPSIVGGTLLLMAGGLMLILGGVSSAAIVQELAIVVIIPALVLMLLGTRFLLALAFPLFYLILMVPVLDGFVDKMHWPFQILAAATAEKMLQFFNIPIFRSGQYLEFPNITLEVANACSGVRYVVSTMLLCIPLAFITQKTWTRRALLFIFALIISVAANPVRVTLVGLWAYSGHGDIHGPSHILQGYVVYVVGMIILFGGAWMLQKNPVRHTADLPKTESGHPEEAGDLHKFNQAWVLSIAMLLSLGTYLQLFKAEPVQLKANLDQLPATIGEWKNTGRGDIKPLSLPGSDFELARVYRNDSGREVTVQIAYFAFQQQDKKLVYHKLQELYVNSEEITVPKGPRHVNINKASVFNGTRNSLTLSWYDLNGRIVANRYMAKFRIALDGVVHRRTNGAFIMVSSMTPPNENDSALRDETAFVQRLLPLLDDYIP